MRPSKSLWLASSALLAAATMMPLSTPSYAADGTFVVAQAQGGGQPEKKKEEKKGPPPHGAPPHRPPPPAAHPQPPAAVQHRPSPPPAAHRPPPPPHPAQTAPVHRPPPPHPAQTAPVHRPPPPHPAQTAPVRKPAPPQPAQVAPVHKPAPVAQPKPPQPQQPAAQQKPPQGTPPSRRAGPERRDHQGPAPSGAQQGAPAAAIAPTASQPVKPRNANEFIRKNNAQPQRTMKDVRQERRTIRQDGRTVIQEGDRAIVRERDHTFIRHNEDQRFAIGARDVRVGQRNGDTVTVIVRPDGVSIINTTDRDGHLIRRIRRDRNGHEYVIIDNRRPRFGGIFIDVPPPQIRMPRQRYIIDADRADERDIYDLLIAPPVEPIEGYYSLAQVRYNAHLRDYMRRLDLDIHFDTGSWQLTPDQMDRLRVVADSLNRAIDRNQREVFLIEGHTDAVGSEEDNLSLSDRRAEAVAVALTEEFHVPPENLVTQGYGEQELKVPTSGPSRANRRVAIRRITPLIDRTAGR